MCLLYAWHDTPRKTSELLAIGEEEGPVAYQLLGSEPIVLAHAVYELSEVEQEIAHELPGPPPKPWSGYSNDRRPVLFDLNAGCPVPKIVKNGEGSALLKNPDLLYDCVSAMVDASRRVARTNGDAARVTGGAAAMEDGKPGDADMNGPRPVTVKIRKGFARDEDLSVENAKAIEEAGAAAITVHGRCREQYYEGKADWDCIARVKSEVSIPVIGNGDVMTGADAIRMMEYTGCDGVMIARGALGNPWIFTEAIKLIEMMDSGKSPSDVIAAHEESHKVSDEERIQTLLKHIDLVAKFKDEYTAVREMRKHVGWYIKGMHGAAELRRKVNTITDLNELKEVITGILR